MANDDGNGRAERFLLMLQLLLMMAPIPGAMAFIPAGAGGMPHPAGAAVPLPPVAPVVAAPKAKAKVAAKPRARAKPKAKPPAVGCVLAPLHDKGPDRRPDDGSPGGGNGGMKRPRTS